MKYIYLAKQGEDLYKVGMAIDVKKRIQSLQTSNPIKIELVMTRLVEDAYTIEQATHKYVHRMRSGGGTEWFKLTHEEAIDLAIHICKNNEVNVTEEITVRHMLNRQNDMMAELNSKLTVALKNKNEAEMPIKRIDNLPILKKPKLEKVSYSYVSEDKLMELAKKVFIAEGKASTSLLQRKLSIGYGRAARIVEKLELEGKIGAWNGQAVREVYMTE